MSIIVSCGYILTSWINILVCSLFPFFLNSWDKEGYDDTFQRSLRFICSRILPSMHLFFFSPAGT